VIQVTVQVTLKDQHGGALNEGFVPMEKGKRGRPPRPKADLTQNPMVTKLVADWPNLDRFQKGAGIAPLRVLYTRQQIADAVGCSEKRIRDLEFFGMVRPEKQAVLTGIGTKKLLAQKRQYLKRERERKRFKRNQEKLSRGKRRSQLLNRLERILVRWIRENLTPWHWDPFLAELLTPKLWETKLREHKPFCHECDPDWQKIIDSSRPTSLPPVSFHGDALYDKEMDWLARWYPRCLPIPGISPAAVERARKTLRERLVQLKVGELYRAR
jgi:hypothetical protein